MEFKAVVTATGGATTGIVVPPEVVEALGGGKKPKVVAAINGYSYRSSVAVMGGDFMLPVSADVRAKAGVAAGDNVTVGLQLDTEERTVTVPDDLAAALAANPAAQAKFEVLSYSKKRFYVEPIDQAKAPETRQKRIDKVVADLSS